MGMAGGKPRMIKCQLLNSSAFFPTADSVYCRACSSLSCCLICS